MNKTFTTLLILGIVLLGAYAVLQKVAPSFGGQTIYEVPDFREGINVGTTRQYSISRAGIVTAPGLTVGTSGITIGSSGTAITKYRCTSNASFDPGSFSSTTAATSSVALVGAALGDRIMATFATTTQADQWYVTGNVSASGSTASATIAFVPVAGTAAWNAGLNLNAGTLKVCYLQ